MKTAAAERIFKSANGNYEIVDNKGNPYIELEANSDQLQWDTYFVDKDKLSELIEFLQKYQEIIKK
jgi:hypothetical protein